MLSAVISSKLSYPAMPMVRQLVHQRLVHPGPLVLGTALFKLLTDAVDRDRTVSRRSEPNSRPALMGEQPNPWDLLQPQDATSRHRGAKRNRLYESGSFSPTFVSVRLVSLTVKRSYANTLTIRFPSVPRTPLCTSVTL